MPNSPVVAFPTGVDISVLQPKVTQVRLSEQDPDIQQQLLSLIEMAPAPMPQKQYMALKAKQKVYVFDDRNEAEGGAISLHFFRLIHTPDGVAHVHVKPIH